jgi:aryl-alcohol dehydrogenase-like predicted oxidoreductase
MERRALYEGGPELSVVGLGCNNFGMRIDADATAAVVNAALDAGITHFDTAEMYGGGKSEEFLGAALGSRRDEVVIATKYTPRPNEQAYTPGVLAARIREALETSLRRLGTDRIDLYYQHYPDKDAPVDEALDTLNELVQAGKVLHLANSNDSAEQITEADRVAAAKGWARFGGTQIEWSLLARDALLPARIRPADRQVPPGAGVPGGVTPGLQRVLRRRRHRRELRQGGGLRALRRRARPHDHRAGDRLAAGAAVGHVGDRRGHEAGADRRQRRRRGVDAHPRRGRRSRRPLTYVTYESRAR